MSPFLEEEILSDAFSKFHVRDAPFYGIFHRFTKPDTGDAHDHPFPMRIMILKGGYIEQQFILSVDRSRLVGGRIIRRCPGDSFTIAAGTVHKIIELLDSECWTYMTPGLHERNWGFYRFDNGDVLHRFNDESEFTPLQTKQSFTGTK